MTAHTITTQRHTGRSARRGIPESASHRVLNEPFVCAEYESGPTDEKEEFYCLKCLYNSVRHAAITFHLSPKTPLTGKAENGIRAGT